jgi:SAM-dependent methyltransferase
MHASSLENMQLCVERFVRGSALETQAQVRVLDVGGADHNGSYRQIFADPRYDYTVADIDNGPGVDLLLADPYHLPLADGAIDIVVSGQMLEHCEFFWLAFGEMIRVLRPGGFLFLIAPSAGPEHRYPVDCYRFYPDAYRALARHAGCTVLDIWLDERGPWRDLVGVFSRGGTHGQTTPVAQRPPAPAPPLPPAPPPPTLGKPEEEIVKGAVHYLKVLAQLHAALRPGSYLEIGVRHGKSLALAKGPAVGVDPAPEITARLGAQTTVASQTSDLFFAAPDVQLAAPPDFAFIDGLHHAEAALRDLMNIERRAAPNALVVIDDVLPNHPAQAERGRRTRVWTGDIWKLVPLLRRVRPDLSLVVLDTAPSGLLLIGGLDPANRVLWNAYNQIVRELVAPAEPPPEMLNRSGVVAPEGAAWRRFCDDISSAHPPTRAALAGALQRLASGRRWWRFF